jgi:serine/threonine protein kinase
METIGRYRIIERIGRGGMGQVFKAQDPTLGRIVAVKLISSEIDVTDELRPASSGKPRRRPGSPIRTSSRSMTWPRTADGSSL